MKVLVITANFAPRGASPAVRTVHLVKYYARLGHSVRVVTYEDETLTLFSPPDDTLSRKVPPEVQVVRVPAGPLRRRLVGRGQPGTGTPRAAKSRLAVHPLIPFLIPDPHIDAVPAFLREAVRQVNAFAPDVVITHGYPFSMHVVGARLKSRYPRIRWIADYGDPWSGNPFSELRRPRWREILDYRLEPWILRRADRVAVTTQPTRELYESQFPFLRGRIHVAPMGFDPDDVAEIKARDRSESERNEMWLVHTGRLYAEARDPLPFVRAVAALPRRAEGSLRVFLVGEVEETIRAEILRSPAKDLFTFIPWVPVAESISWMKSADYLVLFGNRESVQVPGKVYQYVGAGRPILMLSLFDKDATIPIAMQVPGSVVVPTEEARIVRALTELQDRGKAERSAALHASAQYSWPQIAKSILEGLGAPEVPRDQ